MGASPKWKVYSNENEYLAAVRYPEHAAMIVAGIGENGTTIRFGHDKRLAAWTESQEHDSAGESYDGVADTLYRRLSAWRTSR